MFGLDWDILLGILGFIFFVILPMFSKKDPKKQQTEKQQSEKRSGLPGMETVEPQNSTAPARPVVTASTNNPAQPHKQEPGSLKEFLDTIRQQVEDANRQERGELPKQTAQPSQAQTPPVAAPVPAPPLATAPPARRTILGNRVKKPLISSAERRIGSVGQRAEGETFRGHGPSRPTHRRASLRTFEDTEFEQKVIRPAFMKVNRDTVLHGMIWHEILSEPKGQRIMRRSK